MAVLNFTAGADNLNGEIFNPNSFVATDPSFVNANDAVFGGVLQDTLVLNSGVDAAFSILTNPNLFNIEQVDYQGTEVQILSMSQTQVQNGLSTFNGRVGEIDRVVVTMDTQFADFSGVVTSDIETFGIKDTVGVDTITGTFGDDIIQNRTGADTLYGGDGNDRYDVADTGTQIFEDNFLFSGSADRVFASVDFALVDNVEQLHLTGTGDIDGSGTAGDNLLYGNAGANVLSGLDGDDQIRARAGDDILLGGVGNDSLWGEVGSDQIDGGAGEDRLYGGDQDDTLTGGVDNDYLYGGGDLDQMFGGDGDDRMYGDTGSDTMTGGIGLDRIYGGAQDDAMMGEAGNDVLQGGLGLDTLTGGEGYDQLYGGANADMFAIESEAANRDVIRDFSTGDLDKVLVSQIEFGALGVGFFQANTTGKAEDATDRLIYNETNGFLYFDADGTGSAGRVLVGSFTGAPTLAETDFIVM